MDKLLYRKRESFNNRTLNKSRKNIQIINLKNGKTRTIVHDKGVNSSNKGYLKTVMFHDILRYNKYDKETKEQQEKAKNKRTRKFIMSLNFVKY